MLGSFFPCNSYIEKTIDSNGTDCDLSWVIFVAGCSALRSIFRIKERVHAALLGAQEGIKGQQLSGSGGDQYRFTVRGQKEELCVAGSHALRRANNRSLIWLLEPPVG